MSTHRETWLVRWSADEASPRCEEDGFRGEAEAPPADCEWIVGTGPAEARSIHPSSLCDRPDRAVEALRGSFALAACSGGRLTAVRDPVGLQPCFWRQGADRDLFVSPSLRKLLRASGGRVGISRAGLAEIVADVPSSRLTEETLFEGVRRIPSGSALTAERAVPRIERYWDPLPPEAPWLRQSETGAVLEALETAVGRALAAGGDSIALSGGFDSVSLAILARRLQGRGALSAFSLRYPFEGIDEGPVQEAVARALGLRLHLRSVDLDHDRVLARSLAQSASLPSPVQSPWQGVFASVVAGAADRDGRGLVLGTGGDEMFGVDVLFAADLLARGDLVGLWRHARAWQRGSPLSALRVARVALWNGAARPWLGSAIRKGSRAIGRETWIENRRARSRIPPWIPEGPLREELLDRARSQGDGKTRSAEDVSSGAAGSNGRSRYRERLRSLFVSPLVQIELDQSHAWLENQDLTGLYPYFDRDVVELALRLHPDELIANGRPKAPLRRFVHDHIPHVEMPRKKVDFGRVASRVIRGEGRDLWNRMGGATALADLGIVDPAALEVWMKDYFEGRHQETLRLWFVLAGEVWAREWS